MAFMPDIFFLSLAAICGLAAGYAFGRWRTLRHLRAAQWQKAPDGSTDGSGAVVAVPMKGEEAGGPEAQADPATPSTGILEPALVKSSSPVSGERDDPVTPSPVTAGLAEASAGQAPSPGGAEDSSGAAAAAGEAPPVPPRKRVQRTAGRLPSAPAPEAAPAGELKQVRGIGPRLEAALAALGITRLEQVAAWSAEDAARIGEVLGMRGRPERQDWAGQARALLRPLPAAPDEAMPLLFPELAIAGEGGGGSAEESATPPEESATFDEESGFLFPELAREPPARRRRRRPG